MGCAKQEQKEKGVSYRNIPKTKNENVEDDDDEEEDESAEEEKEEDGEKNFLQKIRLNWWRKILLTINFVASS